MKFTPSRNTRANPVTGHVHNDRVMPRLTSAAKPDTQRCSLACRSTTTSHFKSRSNRSSVLLHRSPKAASLHATNNNGASYNSSHNPYNHSNMHPHHGKSYVGMPPDPLLRPNSSPGNGPSDNYNPSDPPFSLSMAHVLLFVAILVGGIVYLALTLQVTSPESIEFKDAMLRVGSRVLNSIAFRQLLVIASLILLVRFGLNWLVRYLGSWTKVNFDRTKTYYVIKEVYQPLELLLFIAGVCTIADAFVPQLISVPKNVVSHFVRATLAVSFIVCAASMAMRFKRQFCQENAWQAEMNGDITSQRRWEAYDKLGTFAVYVLAFIFVVQAVGLEVTSVLAIGGVGGLAIGLAGREIFENLFNGFLILTSNPFEVGDEVCFYPNNNKVEGLVMDIGWYRTLIRSFEREVYIIPNAVFSKNTVLNITRKGREWRFYEMISVRVQDVSKVNAIVSDMRRIIKNDSRILNSLHKRVYLDKITMEDIKIYISFYVEAATRDVFMTIKQDFLLGFIDCMHRNGAQLAQKKTMVELVGPGSSNATAVIDAFRMGAQEDKNMLLSSVEDLTLNQQQNQDFTAPFQPTIERRRKVEPLPGMESPPSSSSGSPTSQQAAAMAAAAGAEAIMATGPEGEGPGAGDQSMQSPLRQGVGVNGNGAQNGAAADTPPLPNGALTTSPTSLQTLPTGQNAANASSPTAAGSATATQYSSLSDSDDDDEVDMRVIDTSLVQQNNARRKAGWFGFHSWASNLMESFAISLGFEPSRDVLPASAQNQLRAQSQTPVMASLAAAPEVQTSLNNVAGGQVPAMNDTRNTSLPNEALVPGSEEADKKLSDSVAASSVANESQNERESEERVTTGSSALSTPLISSLVNGNGTSKIKSESEVQADSLNTAASQVLQTDSSLPQALVTNQPSRISPAKDTSVTTSTSTIPVSPHNTPQDAAPLHAAPGTSTSASTPGQSYRVPSDLTPNEGSSKVTALLNTAQAGPSLPAPIPSTSDTVLVAPEPTGAMSGATTGSTNSMAAGMSSSTNSILAGIASSTNSMVAGTASSTNSMSAGVSHGTSSSTDSTAAGASHGTASSFVGTDLSVGSASAGPAADPLSPGPPSIPPKPAGDQAITNRPLVTAATAAVAAGASAQSDIREGDDTVDRITSSAQGVVEGSGAVDGLRSATQAAVDLNMLAAVVAEGVLRNTADGRVTAPAVAPTNERRGEGVAVDVSAAEGQLDREGMRPGISGGVELGKEPRDRQVTKGGVVMRDGDVLPASGVVPAVGAAQAGAVSSGGGLKDDRVETPRVGEDAERVRGSAGVYVSNEGVMSSMDEGPSRQAARAGGKLADLPFQVLAEPKIVAAPRVDYVTTADDFLSELDAIPSEVEEEDFFSGPSNIDVSTPTQQQPSGGNKDRGLIEPAASAISALAAALPKLVGSKSSPPPLPEENTPFTDVQPLPSPTSPKADSSSPSAALDAAVDAAVQALPAVGLPDTHPAFCSMEMFEQVLLFSSVLHSLNPAYVTSEAPQLTSKSKPSLASPVRAESSTVAAPASMPAATAASQIDVGLAADSPSLVPLTPAMAAGLQQASVPLSPPADVSSGMLLTPRSDATLQATSILQTSSPESQEESTLLSQYAVPAAHPPTTPAPLHITSPPPQQATSWALQAQLSSLSPDGITSAPIPSVPSPTSSGSLSGPPVPTFSLSAEQATSAGLSTASQLQMQTSSSFIPAPFSQASSVEPVPASPSMPSQQLKQTSPSFTPPTSSQTCSDTSSPVGPTAPSQQIQVPSSAAASQLPGSTSSLPESGTPSTHSTTSSSADAAHSVHGSAVAAAASDTPPPEPPSPFQDVEPWPLNAPWPKDEPRLAADPTQLTATTQPSTMQAQGSAQAGLQAGPQGGTQGNTQSGTEGGTLGSTSGSVMFAAQASPQPGAGPHAPSTPTPHSPISSTETTTINVTPSNQSPSSDPSTSEPARAAGPLDGLLRTSQLLVASEGSPLPSWPRPPPNSDPYTSYSPNLSSTQPPYNESASQASTPSAQQPPLQPPLQPQQHPSGQASDLSREALPAPTASSLTDPSNGLATSTPASATPRSMPSIPLGSMELAGTSNAAPSGYRPGLSSVDVPGTSFPVLSTRSQDDNWAVVGSSAWPAPGGGPNPNSALDPPLTPRGPPAASQLPASTSSMDDYSTFAIMSQMANNPPATDTHAPPKDLGIFGWLWPSKPAAAPRVDPPTPAAPPSKPSASFVALEVALLAQSLPGALLPVATSGPMQSLQYTGGSQYPSTSITPPNIQPSDAASTGMSGAASAGATGVTGAAAAAATGTSGILTAAAAGVTSAAAATGMVGTPVVSDSLPARPAAAGEAGVMSRAAAAEPSQHGPTQRDAQQTSTVDAMIHPPPPLPQCNEPPSSNAPTAPGGETRPDAGGNIPPCGPAAAAISTDTYSDDPTTHGPTPQIPSMSEAGTSSSELTSNSGVMSSMRSDDVVGGLSMTKPDGGVRGTEGSTSPGALSPDLSCQLAAAELAASILMQVKATAPGTILYPTQPTGSTAAALPSSSTSGTGEVQESRAGSSTTPSTTAEGGGWRSVATGSSTSSSTPSSTEVYISTPSDVSSDAVGDRDASSAQPRPSAVSSSAASSRDAPFIDVGVEATTTPAVGGTAGGIVGSTAGSTVGGTAGGIVGSTTGSTVGGIIGDSRSIAVSPSSDSASRVPNPILGSLIAGTAVTAAAATPINTQEARAASTAQGSGCDDITEVKPASEPTLALGSGRDNMMEVRPIDGMRPETPVAQGSSWDDVIEARPAKTVVARMGRGGEAVGSEGMGDGRSGRGAEDQLASSQARVDVVESRSDGEGAVAETAIQSQVSATRKA